MRSSSKPERSPSAAADLDEGPFLFSDEQLIIVTIPGPGWFLAADPGIVWKDENGDPLGGAFVFGPWPGEQYIPADPMPVVVDDARHPGYHRR